MEFEIILKKTVMISDVCLLILLMMIFSKTSLYIINGSYKPKADQMVRLAILFLHLLSCFALAILFCIRYPNILFSKKFYMFSSKIVLVNLFQFLIRRVIRSTTFHSGFCGKYIAGMLATSRLQTSRPVVLCDIFFAIELC